MARQDILAVNAATTMHTWGEVIYINDQPTNAIVERDAKRLDDYGNVVARYIEISVFIDVAKHWGAAPVFVIDNKNYRLGPEVDRNTLVRCEVIAK